MRSQRDRKNRALRCGQGCRARAPKGQPVKARGATPGTTPHNVLCALKGHTEQGACGHRSLRWGEVSWGGVTQGYAPLHPGLSPCAALRRGWAWDACPGASQHVRPLTSVAGACGDNIHPGRDKGAEVYCVGIMEPLRRGGRLPHPRKPDFGTKAGQPSRKADGRKGCRRLAPEVGLEPTTTRLTAACSTIELLWIRNGRAN
jgi:hypothetical protein